MLTHTHHHDAAIHYEAAANHFHQAHIAHLAGNHQESAHQAHMGQGHAVLALFHQESAAKEYAKAHSDVKVAL